MSSSIPRLETENLMLRAGTANDLDALAAFFASPRSFYVGGPKTRNESWRALAAGLGHWALRGYGMWHLEEKSSGLSVGSVGIINHEGWDEPELGWNVFEGFEGKGYAYEAAFTSRAYAAEQFGLDGVISYIDAKNTRSLALAKRLGATFERHGELLGYACDIYRHPKQAVAQ